MGVFSWTEKSECSFIAQALYSNQVVLNYHFLFSHLESLISILCKLLQVLRYKTQTKAQLHLTAHLTADPSNATTV